jgi:hypothetical protein
MQPHARVDPPRKDGLAAGVDDLAVAVGLEIGADLGDDTVLD